MAQPSIANYFQTRKRNAIDESSLIRAKKVLILDSDEDETGVTKTKDKSFKEKHVKTRDIIYSEFKEKSSRRELIMAKEKIVSLSSEKDVKFPTRSRVVAKLDFGSDKSSEQTNSTKKTVSTKPKHKKLNNQGDIQKIFQNMQSKNTEEKKIFSHKENIQKINEKTPPPSPVCNAMDNVTKSDLTLNEIKTKLTRSARLAELKASISKFNQHAEKLKAAEQKTKAIQSQGPSLNKFKEIELEVQLSPKKILSPTKAYLSPMKEASPRKNLFGMKSPIKSPLSSPVNVPAYQRFQHLASPGKPTLTLPYNYRNLAELFRSIDTVSSMLFNRKETITFAKLKPAVQEMIRKDLHEHHFAQIKTLYPEAFKFTREKIRGFGCKEGKYELVIKPNILLAENETAMTPNILLLRRRTLFNTLIEKTKEYHNEFLMSLDPPMVIPQEKLTRWHPEFDIEKVPEIIKSELPQPPEEEKLTTGQEVLEKARSLFNCNTRMEKALERLKKIQEDREIATSTETCAATTVTTPVPSILKGIPQSLLEKVRAKQAAKALESMTRNQDQDKEALMYSRLPDIARLMRNTYVAERKGVLALEEVIIKLNNSYRSHLTNSEIEKHLRLLSKCVPGWIVFHDIRGTLFVKLSRDGDMKRVMTKLEQLAKEKSGT